MPDEIGADDGLQGRGRDAGIFSRLDAFQQPGHLARQVAHGLETLRVLADILGAVAVDHVPIGGTHLWHAADAEIFVQIVQRGRGPRPAGAGHRGPGLALEGIAPTVKGPVQERQHPATGVGIIDRGAEDKAVGLPCLGDKVVDPVVVKNAALFGAFPAAETVPLRAPADLDDLPLHPLAGELGPDLAQGGEGTSRGVGTSVEHENFHLWFLLAFLNEF